MNDEIKKINSNLNELPEIKENIKGIICKKCQQPLTSEELNDDNFTLYFDLKNTELNFTKWDKSGWRLCVNIKEITHQQINNWYDCPEVETCQGCQRKFKEKEVKNGIGEEEIYYCFPCHDKKFGEYLNERAKKKPLNEEQKEVMKIVKKAMTEHLNSNYHHGGHDYNNCKGSECEGYKLTLESYGYEEEK